MIPLVIYHANCADGFTAAAPASKPSNAETATPPPPSPAPEPADGAINCPCWRMLGSNT